MFLLSDCRVLCLLYLETNICDYNMDLGNLVGVMDSLVLLKIICLFWMFCSSHFRRIKYHLTLYFQPILPHIIIFLRQLILNLSYRPADELCHWGKTPQQRALFKQNTVYRDECIA